MIDLEFLEKLIHLVDESGLDRLELERGGTMIRLAKTPEGSVTSVSPAAYLPAPAVAAPAAPAVAASSSEADAASAAPSEDSNLEEITSPMVGTFYRAPAPDAPPYVDVGDSVAPGNTLCIIEAMKLMNELEAEVSGRIVEICVQNAEPVEYGQVLFRVEPV